MSDSAVEMDLAVEAGVAMIIDGRRVDTARTFEVLNPATGNLLANAPDCSRSEVDQVLEGAQRAFQTWRLDDAARCTAMRAAATELGSRAMDLARILTAEQGKPLRDSLAEVEIAVTWL